MIILSIIFFQVEIIYGTKFTFTCGKIHVEITARYIGNFITFMYSIKKNETSTVN